MSTEPPKTSPAPAALNGILASPHWSLRVLCFLAFILMVEHARPVLLPIAVAVVFTLMLAPAVRRLRRFGIPDAIGAALVVAAVLGGLGMVGSAMTGPAISWWERAPTSLSQLGDAFDRLRSSVPFLAPPALPARATTRPARNAPIQQTQQPPPDPVKERLAVEGVSFTRALLLQLAAFGLSAGATVMLLYFLLASERWLIARTAQVFPRRRTRGLLLSGVRRAQREVSYYFATQLLINCGVAAAITATSWWFGLPNPLLWGLLTGLLNFIPYLGPLAASGLMLLAGVLTFETLPAAVAPTLALIVVHAIEANLVTPLVVGHRLELNPLAVFVSVLLWGWLWGIPGALIAVPVLLTLRIAFHRIRGMRKFSMYLERGGEVPSWRSLMRVPRRPGRAAAVRAPRSGIGGEHTARQAPRDDL
jgi:predicted PurR-regulated permease PerM